MSHKEDVQQEFQHLLKDALNQCYPYWQTRNRKDRPYELPDAETLSAWVAGIQRPQAKTFETFLGQGRIPEEVKQRLTLLYPQLPRRKHSQENIPELQDLPPIQKRKLKPSGILRLILVCACLLFIGIVLVIVALQSVQPNHAIVWCTTTASHTESINDVSLLYFDAVIPLHNFEDTQFYIYFNSNEYASEEVLSAKKLDTMNQRWVYTILPEWGLSHPEWHNPLLWHVDYEC